MEKIFKGSARKTLVRADKLMELEQMKDGTNVLSAATLQALNTQKTLNTVSFFADTKMSEEAAKEVFVADDMRKTGENEAKSVMRTARYIAIASGSAYMYVVHTRNGRNVFLNTKNAIRPLGNHASTQELREYQYAMNNVLELDRKVQDALDDPKKNNGKAKSLSEEMNGKRTTYMTDVAKKAGKVKYTTVNEKGELVYVYNPTVASPEVKRNTKINREESASLADKIFRHVDSSTPEMLSFSFDDEKYADIQGIPMYVPNEEYATTIDASKYTIPCSIKGLPAIQKADVDIWNENLDASVRLNLKEGKKDVFGDFEIVELFQKLCFRTEMVEALGMIRELIESVCRISVDEKELLVFLANKAAYAAFPKEVSYVDEKYVKFETGRMTKFKNYDRIFHDVWVHNAEVSEELYDVETKKREAFENALRTLSFTKAKEAKENMTDSIYKTETDDEYGREYYSE